MKKIINGILYNTETATLIGISKNGFGYPGDLYYCSERLYQKKSGEYFFFGEGGANSKYSTQISSNEWGGGEIILPLTPVEAKEWAEKNLDADDYINVFGEPEECGNHVTVTAKITTEVYQKLRQAADDAETSLSDYIENLIYDSM